MSQWNHLKVFAYIKKIQSHSGKYVLCIDYCDVIGGLGGVDGLQVILLLMVITWTSMSTESGKLIDDDVNKNLPSTLQKEYSKVIIYILIIVSNLWLPSHHPIYEVCNLQHQNTKTSSLQATIQSSLTIFFLQTVTFIFFISIQKYGKIRSQRNWFNSRWI